MIRRNRGDGRKYFKESTKPPECSKGYCNAILKLLLRVLDTRRHRDKQDLAVALREYIQELEYSAFGLDKMLRRVARNRSGSDVLMGLRD